MPNIEEQTTGRLRLTPMTADDSPELFPILSDPAGWWYEPEHRHVELAITRGFAERASARWTTDGLSYWTARRLDDGVVVGLGGAQRHGSGTWNLSYRIATGEQGNGYATELALAGLAAANEHDPGVAVIAWVLEHNIPSRRVAERIGLVNRGQRVDANDGVERLAYADREL